MIIKFLLRVNLHQTKKFLFESAPVAKMDSFLNYQKNKFSFLFLDSGRVLILMGKTRFRGLIIEPIIGQNLFSKKNTLKHPFNRLNGVLLLTENFYYLRSSWLRDYIQMKKHYKSKIHNLIYDSFKYLRDMKGKKKGF